MIKRKVRLKITTASRQTIRTLDSNLSAPCPLCMREVPTLSRAEAAGVLSIGDLALEELITAGPLHVIETVSGNIRICKDSLFAGTEPPSLNRQGESLPDPDSEKPRSLFRGAGQSGK